MKSTKVSLEDVFLELTEKPVETVEEVHKKSKFSLGRLKKEKNQTEEAEGETEGSVK